MRVSASQRSNGIESGILSGLGLIARILIIGALIIIA